MTGRDCVPKPRAWALLALLVAAAFAPLFLGYHFLPVARYPEFAQGLSESMGEHLAYDPGFQERFLRHRWLYEVEPGWFTLQVPRSLFTADQLRGGVLPLWDPYTGCGASTFASGHFRPFDPFKAPLLVAPGLWTYALSLLLGLAFGAWGAWRWLRAEGFADGARLLGAAVFALNPWSLERIVLQDASAYYLLPWCILGFRGARWGDWRSLARAAAPLLLMGHVGHPEVCALVAAVAAIDYLVAGPDTTRRHKIGALALVSAAVAVSLAILWIPPWELFRSGLSYKKASMIFLYPLRWESFATPASDLYVLPALGGLALAGALWGRRRGLWGALGGLSLLLLMPLPGVGHAAAEALQRHGGIPVFYLKPVLWASLALLAAAGWDALRESTPARRSLAAGAALALAAAGAAFVLRLGPLPPAELALFPVPTLALVSAGALALLPPLWRLGRGAPLAILLLVVAPLAFPLPLHQLAWNRFRLAPHELALWMRSAAPHGRAVSIAFRPSFVVPPNWGQALGVRMGEQNAVLFPNRYLQLYRKSKFPMTLVIFDYPEFEAFRQLGASLVLLPNAAPSLGLPPAFRGAWASAYAVPGASGRLFFARKVAPLDPARDLSLQILELGGGSDAVAVTDSPDGPATAAQPSPGPGEARFLRDGIHEVEVQTRNPAPGLLVLKDTWYRGWRATVDGAPAPICRVNGCFRGVRLPAGEHRVRFLYRPTSLYAAAAVSLLATLLIAALALLPRKSSGPPPRGENP